MNKEQTQDHYETQATKAKQLVHYTGEASKIPKAYTIKDRIAFRVSTWAFNSGMEDVKAGRSKETFDDLFKKYNEETARILGIIK